MALRRSLFSALPLTCLLALSGCGGPGQPAPSLSVDPASAAAASSPPPTPDPRPTQASSTGPARNLPKPVLPEVAKQNTKEGFEAFTQYWFDAVSYGLEMADPEPLQAISVPSCRICNGYISRMEAAKPDSEWNAGPKWIIREFQRNVEIGPLNQAKGVFLLEESSSSRYSAGGDLLKQIDATRDESPKIVHAIFVDGQWMMAEAGNA